MSFETHPHQHAVKVVASALSLDAALSHALAGLVDPQGHHARLAFTRFEVVKIAGVFAPDGVPSVQVTVEAFGAHRG
jgi:hypothetical protein